MNGETGVVARIGNTSPMIGQYSVHVQDFEKIALPQLEYKDNVMLYVIDEIGKMECLSKSFQTAVKELLQREDVVVLATVPVPK